MHHVSETSVHQVRHDSCLRCKRLIGKQLLLQFWTTATAITHMFRLLLINFIRRLKSL